MGRKIKRNDATRFEFSARMEAMDVGQPARLARDNSWTRSRKTVSRAIERQILGDSL